MSATVISEQTVSSQKRLFSAVTPIADIGKNDRFPYHGQMTSGQIASDNSRYRNISKHNQIAALNRVHPDTRKTHAQFLFQANFAIRDRNERCPLRLSECAAVLEIVLQTRRIVRTIGRASSSQTRCPLDGSKTPISRASSKPYLQVPPMLAPLHFVFVRPLFGARSCKQLQNSGQSMSMGMAAAVLVPAAVYPKVTASSRRGLSTPPLA
jgi:hypothetical protein